METVSEKMDDQSVKNLSTSSIHHGYMREALNIVRHWFIGEKYTVLTSAQAEQALRSDETPVGCVFVYDGRIIGRGMNDTNRSLNVGDLEQKCMDDFHVVHRVRCIH